MLFNIAYFVVSFRDSILSEHVLLVGIRHIVFFISTFLPLLFYSFAEVSRAGNVLRILQLDLLKALVSASLNQLKVYCALFVFSINILWKDRN